MNIKRKSGQILVLTLLVVVVILAVGLSVASRNLTNLKTSTQAEQSQRAFSAAEGGVEDVLSKLNAVANVIATNNPGSGCVRETGEIANCALPGNVADPTIVGTVKVKASKVLERAVEPGDVMQLELTGYPRNAYIDVEWIKTGDPTFATLEFIVVCQTGTTCMGDSFTGQFGQHRRASKGGTVPGPASDTTPICGSPLTAGYTCRERITLPDAPNPSNVRIMRIKPFWNRTTIKVTPSDLGSFPVQSYEITSTATTDTGVSRKVEVRRDALPQLPAIFDYALYSGGNIVK